MKYYSVVEVLYFGADVFRYVIRCKDIQKYMEKEASRLSSDTHEYWVDTDGLRIYDKYGNETTFVDITDKVEVRKFDTYDEEKWFVSEFKDKIEILKYETLKKCSKLVFRWL